MTRDEESDGEEDDNESRRLRKKGGEPSPKTASKNIGIKELMTRVNLQSEQIQLDLDEVSHIFLLLRSIVRRARKRDLKASNLNEP